VSVIKVNVTVTKNRNSMAFWHQTCCMGSLHQDATWVCYPGVCDRGQGHCY